MNESPTLTSPRASTRASSSRDVIEGIRRLRPLFLPAWDVASVAFGILGASILLDPPWRTLVRVAVLLLVVQLAAGFGLGTYGGRWPVSSFADAIRVGAAYLVGGLVAVAVMSPGRGVVGEATAAVAGLLGAVVAVSGRAAWRVVYERRLRPPTNAVRTLVVGGETSGPQIVRALLLDPRSAYLPVALLDDDPLHSRRYVMGVPVAGNSLKLLDAAAYHRATAVLIAAPHLAGADLAQIAKSARTAGLEVLILPSLVQAYEDSVDTTAIRPLTERDLLQRREILPDWGAVTAYVTGKRVLVTGAGGSIGSEICRQLAKASPATLIKVDRDESALHATHLSITGNGLLDDPGLVVADIRDRDRMLTVFREFTPEIVFHAAALKHLSLLEMHPTEAVKTNVEGTQSVLDAAVAVGVDCFVNISTDKAADPTSVLGYTKRIAERITANYARKHNGRFISVRFGNVLASRGSVIHTFRAQIARGGPIFVTHKEVTRFFMTVEEAVLLVVQAGGIGRSGEALILDMGEPVSIDEVARRMAQQVDPPVAIEYTGLREGEKLHEQLFGAGEQDHRPVHPLISHVNVPPMQMSSLRLLRSGTDEEVREALHRVSIQHLRSADEDTLDSGLMTRGAVLGSIGRQLQE